MERQPQRDSNSWSLSTWLGVALLSLTALNVVLNTVSGWLIAAIYGCPPPDSVGVVSTAISMWFVT